MRGPFTPWSHLDARFRDLPFPTHKHFVLHNNGQMAHASGAFPSYGLVRDFLH